MQRKRHDWTWPIIVVIVLLMLVHLHAQAYAAAPDADAASNSNQAIPQHVLDRLEMLEHEVARLHDEAGEQWVNDRRAEEIKALVHETISDAQTRASLLTDDAIAGYNNGFFIRSADNNFYLKIRGMIQSRYVFNVRQNAPAGQDGDEGGFEIARTRFAFMGHIIDPTWKFMIWTGYSSSGGTLLLDAYIQKKLPAGFSVTAGQFKVPMWKEWLVSETSQQFIERSLLNAKASGSYTQGIKVDWGNDFLRLTGSFNDGTNSLNANWNNDKSHWAVTGRAEWKVFGDWGNYKTFESWQGSDPLLVFGLAANYQQGETGGTDQYPDAFTWTADALWKFGGGNIFVAAVGSQTSGMDSALGYEPGDYYGLLAQGGYFVTPQVEAFARYEFAVPDQDSIDHLSVASVGVNYFFKKWSAVASLDVGYSFNAMSSYWASSGTGWLVDGSHGQVVVRAQMQLLF